MARYIDADALIEEIVNTPSNCMDTFSVSSVQNGIGYGCVSRQNEIINIINNQPTTFNLDEVVWQAQLLSFRLPKEWEGLDGKNRAVMLDDVIDLLKAGGIDERD